jgi:hypothetical protein
MSGAGPYRGTNHRYYLTVIMLSGHEGELRRHIVADHGEKSLKGFDRSLFSDPKQVHNVEADLVNQRHVLVALGVLDFQTPMASIWPGVGAPAQT